MAAAAAPPGDDIQGLYDEVSRRGLLKEPGSDLQQMAHELRVRGVITDPTQGGLVPPAGTSAAPAAPPAPIPQPRQPGAPPVLPAVPGSFTPPPPPPGLGQPTPIRPAPAPAVPARPVPGPAAVSTAEPTINAPVTTPQGLQQALGFMGRDVAPPPPASGTLPKVAAVSYKAMPEEEALRVSDRRLDELPAAFHHPGRIAAAGGPVEGLRRDQAMATVQLARALPKAQQQWQQDDQRLTQQWRTLNDYRKANEGLLTPAQAKQYQQTAQSLYAQIEKHDARGKQLGAYQQRAQSVLNYYTQRPIHTGINYPQEGQPPISAPIGGAFNPLQGTNEALRHVNQARALMMLKGEYPPAVPFPKGTPVAQQPELIRQKNVVKNILTQLGNELTDQGALRKGSPPRGEPSQVGALGQPDMNITPGQARAMATRLTPWQRSLIPTLRTQLKAEGTARERAGVPGAFLRDVATFGVASLAGGPAGEAAGQFTSRLLQPLENRLIGSGAGAMLGRFLLHQVPRLAAGAGGGAAAGGAAGGFGTLLQGGTLPQAARATGAGALAGAGAGALFAGIHSVPAVWRAARMELGSGWDPVRSPYSVVEAAEAARRVYGLSPQETQVLESRLTRIGKAPAPMKERLFTSLQQNLEQARTAKVAAAPEPRAPTATETVPHEPRVTTADGTSLSLRHMPPEAIQAHGQAAAAGGDAASAAHATALLNAHATHEAHAGQAVPHEMVDDYAKARVAPGNPGMSAARLLRVTGQRFGREDADLGRKLTDAGDLAERGFRRSWLQGEGVEPVVPPTGPVLVSPWRRLSDEQRAKLPVNVRTALLVQDASHSLETLTPGFQPVHTAADLPGKPKTVNEIEALADRLHGQASEVVARRVEPPPPPVEAVPAQPVAQPVPQPVQPVAQPTPAAPAPAASLETKPSGVRIAKGSADLLAKTPGAEKAPAAAEPEPWMQKKAEFAKKHGYASGEELHVGMAKVDPQGEPGVQIEKVHYRGDEPLAQAVVFRDAKGVPKATLEFSSLGEHFNTDKNATILGVYVDPELRRQGIASKLFDTLEKAGYTLGPLSGRMLSTEGASLYHGRAVAKAVAEGRDVPPEVLRDYPRFAQAHAADVADLKEAAAAPEHAALLNGVVPTREELAAAASERQKEIATHEPTLLASAAATSGPAAGRSGSQEAAPGQTAEGRTAAAAGPVGQPVKKNGPAPKRPGKPAVGAEPGAAAGREPGPEPLTRDQVKEGLIVGVKGTQATLKVTGITGDTVQAGVVKPDKAAGYPAGGYHEMEIRKFLDSAVPATLRARRGSIPIGPTLPAERTPPAEEKPVFSDPALEEWRKANRGESKVPDLEAPFMDRLKEGWERWRSVIPGLPDNPHNRPLIEKINRLAKLPNISNLEAHFRLNDVLRNLKPDELQVLEAAAIVPDLLEDVKKGVPLPPGLTPEMLQAEAPKIAARLAEAPQASFALAQWRKAADDTATAWRQSLIDIGQKAPALDREHWWHHAVLDELERMAGASGASSRLKAIVKPGFSFEREGGYNFNTHFIEAHQAVMARMIRLTEENKVIRFVQDPKNGYNIKPMLDARKALAKDDEALSWFRNAAGGTGGGGEIQVRSIPARVGAMAQADALPNDANGRFDAVIREIGNNVAANEVRPAGSEPIPFDPSLTGGLRDYAQWTMEQFGAKPGKPAGEAGAIPATHTPYRFVEGHNFYRTTALSPSAARLAEAVTQGVTDNMTVGREDLRQALAVGRRRGDMVLKNGAAEALERLRDQKPTEFDRVWRGVAGRLKTVAILSPEHLPTFMREKTIGDAVRILRGNPAVAAELPQAARDLYNLRTRKSPPSDELRRWYFHEGARGYVGSFENVGQSLPIDLLEHLSADPKTKAQQLGRFVRGVARLGPDRLDELVRYAGFRAFGKAIDLHGEPQAIGAARRDLALSLTDRDEQARFLSNHLFGALDEVPASIRWLRDRVPFVYWGLMTAQMRSETNLFLNAVWREPKVYSSALKAVGLEDFANKNAGTVRTTNSLLFLTKLAMVTAGALAYNHFRFGKDEEKMDDPSPHLDLGHAPGGGMVVWPRLGALPNVGQLFGLDDPMGYAEMALNGHLTKQELVKRLMRSGPAEFVALSGLAKVPYEMTTRTHLSTGGRIDDLMEYAAQQFHIPLLYEAARRGIGKVVPGVVGRPLKGGFAGQLTATVTGGILVDPDDASFRDASERAREWVREQKGIDAVQKQQMAFTPLSNSLYYYKKAIEFGENDTALKYLAGYARAGGTDQKIHRNLARLEPLYGLNKKQMGTYLKTLGGEDQAQVRNAYRFWQRFVAPKADREQVARLHEEKDLQRFAQGMRLVVDRALQREQAVKDWLAVHPVEKAKQRTAAKAAVKAKAAWAAQVPALR